MATWVRSFSADLTGSADTLLSGPADLDNDTAPGDFLPANVTSVRFQFTLSHTGTFNTGTGADSYSLTPETVEIESSGGTQLATVNPTGTITNGTATVAVDLTDNSPNTGATEANWTSAQFNGVTSSQITDFNQGKGPDGVVPRILASSVTITITYTSTTIISPNQSTETDAAQAISTDKVYPPQNQSLETDTAQAATSDKVYPELNQSLSTDSANAVTVVKTTIVNVNQATETDTAQSVTVAKTYTLAQATETDTAGVVTGGPLQAPDVGTFDHWYYNELTLIGPGGDVGTGDYWYFGEQINARVDDTLVVAGIPAVDQAFETDAANSVTVAKVYPALNQATETDTAGAVVTSKTYTVAQSTETDLAQPKAGITFGLAQSLSVDSANAVVAAKTYALNQAFTTDTANAVTVFDIESVNQALSTDTAQPVTVAKVYTVAQSLVHVRSCPGPHNRQCLRRHGLHRPDRPPGVRNRHCQFSNSRQALPGTEPGAHHRLSEPGRCPRRRSSPPSH
jgi:hypothetical protein